MFHPLAAADATLFMFTSATGTATYPLVIPNSTSYIGVELFHQWAVFDAANPIGIVVSVAGKAWLGIWSIVSNGIEWVIGNS